MIRVKDENGNIVDGIYKDSLGTIIVRKESEYKKHKQHKEVINRLTDKIEHLSTTVDKLTKLVVELTKEKLKE